MNTSKTYLPKVNEINRTWHHIDATGKVLGRLATDVAMKISGKNKVYYAPHIDCGDFVVITNASKIVLTGKKLEQKLDFRHSGYPGGGRLTPYKKLMQDSPEKAVMLAVKGMLSKNKMGDKQLTRLKVYRDDKHPHAAQFTKSAKAAETPAAAEEKK